jgi:hypothetical protein
VSVDPKVYAAISSAIGFYLQAEQEALALSSSRPAQPPPLMSGLFALAGRKAAMDIRWTWQMRLPR